MFLLYSICTCSQTAIYDLTPVAFFDYNRLHFFSIEFFVELLDGMLQWPWCEAESPLKPEEDFGESLNNIQHILAILYYFLIVMSDILTVEPVEILKQENYTVKTTVLGRGFQDVRN